MDPHAGNNDKPGPDHPSPPGRRPESWLNELDSLVPIVPADPASEKPGVVPPFGTAPSTWPELDLSNAKPEPINVTRPALLDQLPADLAIINDTWNVQQLQALDDPPASSEPAPDIEPTPPPIPADATLSEQQHVEPTQTPATVSADPGTAAPADAEVPIPAASTQAEPATAGPTPRTRVDERTVEFVQPRRSGSHNAAFLRVLSVAAVFLVVAAGACAWYYFHMCERMAAVSKERSGVDYLARCRDMVNAAGKHRDLAVTYATNVSGRNRVRADMRSAADQVDSALNATRLLESRWAAFGGKSLSADAHQDVVRHWARIQTEFANRLPNGSAEGIASRYQPLLESVRRLSDLAALESGLARDPDAAIVILQDCWGEEIYSAPMGAFRKRNTTRLPDGWTTQAAEQILNDELGRRFDKLHRSMILGFGAIVAVLALALAGLLIVAPKSAG